MWPGRPGLIAAAAAATALVAVGCGGGDDDTGQPTGSSRSPSSAGGSSKLALSADPTGKLAFDKKSLQGKAGRVTIVMKNPAALSHNVSLEGPGLDKEGKTVGEGGTSTVSATLKPGTYLFYCSVPGHREGGMEGKLTIR
jgi:uncharacterized cupredoxin-like copper-binding protein